MTSVQCDQCSVTSEMPGAFSKEKKLFRNSFKVLCPNCRDKSAISLNKWILFAYALIGLLGPVLIYFPHTKPLGWVCLNVFLLELFMILSLMPHEWGHALAARLAGWRVFKIYIGVWGPPLFKCQLFGFETEFRPIPLTGLVSIAPPTLDYFRLKKFFIFLAGPLANFILAGIVYQASGRSAVSNFITGGTEHLCPLSAFFYANVMLLITNLFPYKVGLPGRKVSSDGLALLQIPRMNQQAQTHIHAAWFTLQGAACRDKSLYEEARGWFEKGISLYPDNLDLLIHQGLNFLDLRQFSAARDCFVQSLSTAAKGTGPYFILLNNIAYTDVLLEDKNLLPEADVYSDEAIRHLAWNPSIIGTRGTVLLELGRIEEAVPLLQTAWQKHENLRNRALNGCSLAIAEARRGNPAASQEYLGQAQKLDPHCILLERAQKAVEQATQQSKKPETSTTAYSRLE